MARCGWHVADGERFFLPQCMGGAVYGQRGCTCPRHTKSTEQRLSELEQRVKQLEAKEPPHDTPQ